MFILKNKEHPVPVSEMLSYTFDTEKKTYFLSSVVDPCVWCHFVFMIY